MFRETQPVFGRFREIVVSGVEKIAKPDPAIFELFLERYELAARDCVFIDDSPANIATAKALGFTALHFVDPQTLRADLLALGFPV